MTLRLRCWARGHSWPTVTTGTAGEKQERLRRECVGLLLEFLFDRCQRLYLLLLDPWLPTETTCRRIQRHVSVREREMVPMLVGEKGGKEAAIEML